MNLVCFSLLVDVAVVVGFALSLVFISFALTDQKKERRRAEQSVSLSLCSFAMSGYTSTWVQCDNPGCLKWRRISRASAEALGERSW